MDVVLWERIEDSDGDGDALRNFTKDDVEDMLRCWLVGLLKTEDGGEYLYILIQDRVVLAEFQGLLCVLCSLCNKELHQKISRKALWIISQRIASIRPSCFLFLIETFMG